MSTTGGFRARRLLAAHLEGHVPAVLERLAVDVEVPAVDEWCPHWKPMAQVTGWPVVMVAVLRGRLTEQLGMTPEGPLERWQWTTRTFVYVRGDDHGELADRVQLIAAAAAEAMLARPRLDDRARIDPVGLTVSLSEVGRVGRLEGSIAGAYVEATVILDEVATIPPAGTADTVVLTAGPMEG